MEAIREMTERTGMHVSIQEPGVWSQSPPETPLQALPKRFLSTTQYDTESSHAVEKIKSLFNKWWWKRWILACTKNEVWSLTFYTNLYSRWIKVLDIRPETINGEEQVVHSRTSLVRDVFGTSDPVVRQAKVQKKWDYRKQASSVCKAWAWLGQWSSYFARAPYAALCPWALFCGSAVGEHTPHPTPVSYATVWRGGGPRVLSPKKKKRKKLKGNLPVGRK